MGPVGCSLLMPALCTVKNIYLFITTWLHWTLAEAPGTFIAHHAGSFVTVHGLVAPHHVWSQLPDRESEWCLLPCKAEFNHWTARKVSDSCVREGEHRFEFGGHSLIVWPWVGVTLLSHIAYWLKRTVGWLKTFPFNPKILDVYIPMYIYLIKIIFWLP